MATGKIYKSEEIKLDILKSNPPKLSITSKGKTRTTGWRDGQLMPRFNLSHPALNGVYEFDFIAQIPTGITLQILTPISANYTLSKIPSDLKKIIVYAEINKTEQSYTPSTSVPQIQPSIRIATGYSENMNFDEAFSNAIDNLPPSTPPYPDYLESIRVIDTGALFGGIAGISKMYVTIESN